MTGSTSHTALVEDVGTNGNSGIVWPHEIRKGYLVRYPWIGSWVQGDYAMETETDKSKNDKEQNAEENNHENGIHPIPQALKNISTGIGFLLNPAPPLLSQLPLSDDSEDVDEREFWRRMCLGGLCVRVWVWVLVRVCNGDELGDARGRGGEDMIGSRGGGARLDPDPDPNFKFDFDTNTPRNGLRIVRGGSAASEDIVERLHRLRSWWILDLGVGGKENGEMGLLSSNELEDEKEEWDWLLEKESRDERGASESVLARGGRLGIDGIFLVVEPYLFYDDNTKYMHSLRFFNQYQKSARLQTDNY
ncbi:hypothetical protein F4604DRAFT_1683698 [Suillus subluteus]|nr:hypothetical protein F4604DRAFT_1683698 [Suillus subluteus]